jgi:hypothetical protein
MPFGLVTLSGSFNTALAHVAAALAFKIGAINLLTVRSRLLTNDWGAGKPDSKPFTEETKTSDCALRKIEPGPLTSSHCAHFLRYPSHC